MPVTDNSQAGEIEQPLEEAADVQEQTPDEGSAGDEQQPEKLYTRADVEALLADFEKKMDSRIQSQVARSENRTNQRIQQRLAGLEQNRAVLNLSDEEYAKAQDAIISEEQKKAFQPQSPQGKQTQQTPSEDGDGESGFMSDVNAVFQQEGATLTVKELAALPEWNDPNGDPLNTLLAIKLAAREKAARQKTFKETAKGRVTQSGTKTSDSTNISGINDSSTLYEMGDKQIRERNKR